MILLSVSTELLQGYRQHYGRNKEREAE